MNDTVHGGGVNHLNAHACPNFCDGGSSRDSGRLARCYWHVHVESDDDDDDDDDDDPGGEHYVGGDGSLPDASPDVVVDDDREHCMMDVSKMRVRAVSIVVCSH